MALEFCGLSYHRGWGGEPRKLEHISMNIWENSFGDTKVEI